jgi:hypothetical protein
MAMQKEIWAADIKEQLYPEDSFVVLSEDDSVFSDGKKVHRAVAGSVDPATRNRATVPAVVKRRVDADTEYELDEFTTDPILIQDIEEVEVNYQKRTSVLRQQMKQLNLDVAKWMNYHWAAETASTIIRTGGADRAALATQFGATGNRKMIRVDEFIKLAQLFDDMEVPEEGRNILVPTGMYYDLVTNHWKDLLVLQAEGKAVLAKGEMMNLFGFRVWKRSSKNFLTYTNAGTPVRRTPDAANATTVNAAALAWHPDFVTRAKGDVKVFENIDDATMYGSVFSSLVRAGGRKFYPDGTGVAAIVESV